MQETPKCIFCRTTLPHSNQGIVILGQYICASCERKITNLAWDDPDYEVYKSGLKKIWCCKEA
ncbi:Sigma-G inhibitor, Gin [Desulfotomaculum nigrificans CO-1-SRB]|uniref:Sigma-G inhibitor, Gin n=1 Tax=Desulfotomaculum nigrificans (strain DSM 14880 / VKM B-2319 / CO-1-SRB) TaxID=868595 RepID=F6B3X7_DESCC|nr:sigma factor G inhibitor Gin [Desulfotomaculum nigrificans]AEF92942.1 Sigma-G inhibitor, Gin [Desulfotomaculum nigrificans CO-1-SRB]